MLTVLFVGMTGRGVAAPIVNEQELFAFNFVDDDLTPFLEKKAIKIDCNFKKNDAIKKRFTGLVTTCVTKREWMRPAPGKPYGHHNITRVKWLTQYKDGLLDGFEIFVGGKTRSYKEFEAGRMVKSVYTLDGRMERKSYPDCFAAMTEAKLIAVPAEYRFVQAGSAQICGSYRSVHRADTVGCKEIDSGKPVNGQVRLYNDHGSLLAVQNYTNGFLNGLTMEYKGAGIQVASFSNGKETRYAAFEGETCKFIPGSDPRKRTTRFDLKAFNPYFMYVQAYRPDTNDEYLRQRKWSVGYSLLYMPVIYLGAPFLVWIAPDLYRDSYPTVSASYFFTDHYWEGGLGILNFKADGFAAYGHSFHYTYKKVDDRSLWGVRYSAGVSAFIIMAALQGSLHFEGKTLSQAGLDFCFGPFLSACVGSRIPLRDEVRDLEAPVQLSLKLGI